MRPFPVECGSREKNSGASLFDSFAALIKAYKNNYEPLHHFKQSGSDE